MILSPLKDALEILGRKRHSGPNHYSKREGGRGGLGRADKDKTQHACVWTVCSRQPAFAATFRGEKKKRGKKNVGKCLSDRSMYRVYLLLFLLCWFSLIRTQAFSVFSEVSCCVAAPSETEQYTNVRQKQQLYEQKRRPVDDLVFIPHLL